MSRKRNKKITILSKTSEEASMEAVRRKSMQVGCGAFIGIGAHKDRKNDKKLRRNESKKMCRNWE